MSCPARSDLEFLTISHLVANLSDAVLAVPGLQRPSHPANFFGVGDVARRMCLQFVRELGARFCVSRTLPLLPRRLRARDRFVRDPRPPQACPGGPDVRRFPL